MKDPITELPQTLTRRHFMQGTAAATMAALLGTAPRQLVAQSAAKVQPKADTLILLWMAGGMAQTETFDPKKYTAYEPGMESARVLSTFPSIDTVVDNIKLSQGLERIAGVLDRGTLIRTHRVGDLGRILHTRHQYHWHTGYEPPQSVAAPHIGAVIARTLGPKNPEVPAFLDVGQSLDIGGESDGVRAFHTAGFLGSEYGPFFIPDPRDAAAVVRPPSRMTDERFRLRYNRYRKLIGSSPILEHGSDYQQESLCARPRMRTASFSRLPRRRLTSPSNQRKVTTFTTPGDSDSGVCSRGD
jgi:hypothetical protein